VAEVVNTNQFKNGMHIEIDNEIWRIVEFQHVKPGKGGAFVRTKVKNLGTGSVVDKTFRAGEKFSRIYTRSRTSSTSTTPATRSCSWTRRLRAVLAAAQHRRDELQYIQPSSMVQMLNVDGSRRIQMPSAVELAVTDTEPGVRADTVSNVTKPATLETGAVVQVPLFVNIGDKSRSTREVATSPRVKRLALVLVAAAVVPQSPRPRSLPPDAEEGRAALAAPGEHDRPDRKAA